MCHLFSFWLGHSGHSLLISKELAGVLLRSTARWLEEEERPTRFFFRLEHERIQRNFISFVSNSDDIQVFSSEELNVTMYVFILSYSLLNLSMLVVSKLVWLALKKHLSVSQKQSCEGFLSLQGLTDSVKSLNLGKLPGSDGLSVKFYLHFGSSSPPRC